MKRATLPPPPKKKLLVLPHISRMQFNQVAFGNDVLLFRRNDLKIARPEFATLFGTWTYVIDGIENAKAVPGINLAYNLCVAMGKSLCDYFVPEK